MPTNSTPTTKTNRRRKRYAKFALATVGLAGVGAALTSAAWTDDIAFMTDTSAATVDLQGSVTGADGSWFDVLGDDETSAANPIVVDSDAFGNLLPGDERTITVHLRNEGSVDLALGAPQFEFVGGFASALAAADVEGTYGTSTIAPDASTTLQVAVTVPADWDAANMGATGNLLVTVAAAGTHG